MGLEFYDKTNQYEREDIDVIRRSGSLAILCGALQITLIIILAVFAFLSVWSFAPSFEVFFELFFELATPILSAIVALLQIIIIATGIHALSSQARSGKTLIVIAIIFLMIFILTVPISLIFFWHVINWGPFGMITASISLLKTNLLYTIWFLFMITSLVISGLSFGILLVKLDSDYRSGDLMVPGVFFLLQAIPPIGYYTIFFSSFFSSIMMGVSILTGLLATIGFIVLGSSLRKVY